MKAFLLAVVTAVVIAVVWAGVASAGPGLFGLQRRVGDAVRAAGLATGLVPARKPFHPHITVGGCKGVGSAALQALLERHEHSEFGSFEVSGITLYASILHPHGPEHLAVFRHGLESA